MPSFVWLGLIGLVVTVVGYFIAVQITEIIAMTVLRKERQALQDVENERGFIIPKLAEISAQVTGITFVISIIFGIILAAVCTIAIKFVWF